MVLMQIKHALRRCVRRIQTGPEALLGNIGLVEIEPAQPAITCTNDGHLGVVDRRDQVGAQRLNQPLLVVRAKSPAPSITLRYSPAGLPCSSFGKVIQQLLDRTLPDCVRVFDNVIFALSGARFLWHLRQCSTCTQNVVIYLRRNVAGPNPSANNFHWHALTYSPAQAISSPARPIWDTMLCADQYYVSGYQLSDKGCQYLKLVLRSMEMQLQRFAVRQYLAPLLR